LLDDAFARDDFPDEEPLFEDPRERLEELFDELELLRLPDDELLEPDVLEPDVLEPDDDPRLRLEELFDFALDDPFELPRLLLPEDARLRLPPLRFGEALSDFEEPFELDFVDERRRLREFCSPSCPSSSSSGSSSSYSASGSSDSSSSASDSSSSASGSS